MMFKIILSLCFVLSFQFSRAQYRQPNIVWITCEDISPFIGAYGNKVVRTPNIDQLAKEGVRYTHAYTTAGVCAPSRSAIITGMYQTSIGTQHMRTSGDPKYQPVPPYSAVIPDYVKCFPEYLRENGYYCTNNEKQDYQFTPPITVWDENGPTASFRNRPTGRPFFSVYNLFITHESTLFGRKDSLTVNPSQVEVPPFYPDTKVVRLDIARLFTNIEMMDKQVGEIIRMLKDDDVYDNTFIFFYSDHGGALPWMKREVLERGTHIPLIIRFPKGERGGTINDELISAVDFAPTVLSLAEIKIPSHLQGQAFLGAQKSKILRQYVFAARDRMDTEYDRVRMVRNKRFRYLYNYMPEKPFYQNIEFRLAIPMMRDILQKKNEGTLDSIQMRWFKTKPVEELYDVENDPYETRNLIHEPTFATTAVELRNAFQQWTKTIGDRSELPEIEMIKKMWNGENEPPNTATPSIIKTVGGVKISCATNGASIGYRISKASPSSLPLRQIQTWDYGFVYGRTKNGSALPSTPSWQIYHGEVISLSRGDTLKVNAMRIGYNQAVLNYVGEQ